LSAARGCVGKTEVPALWRHRGATPPGVMTHAAPAGAHARTRRPRHAAARRAAELRGPNVRESPEIQEPFDHAPEIPEPSGQAPETPEIQDPDGQTPEIPDHGNPEPDLPEPDLPEPEIPEPEPEHPPAAASA
jgi:hypothetical protein